MVQKKVDNYVIMLLQITDTNSEFSELPAMKYTFSYGINVLKHIYSYE